MPVRLLLIEDNPGDAVIFREKIEGGPIETVLVHVVRLGEALEQLEADPFDLVFVDLSLPDAQGLEAVDRVRRAAPHLPLIVLTGLDDATAAAEAKKRGAVDYLVKWYVDSDSLARYVRYAIEQYRLMGPVEAAAPAVSAPGGEAEVEAEAEGSVPGPARVRAREREPEAPARKPPEPRGAATGEASFAAALEAALAVAEETAARAEHLAGSLRVALDLARVEGAPAPEPLDVLPLVQQAIDRARGRALHAGIPVHLRAEQKRVLATADRQALCHALERLLALALSTADASGVRLAAAADGARVTLRAAWSLRRGVRLDPLEDPLVGLDVDLCRRLVLCAGGACTLRADAAEAALVLTFAAPAHG